MISEEATRIASHCRHYAMCKIDFLGTGLCPSGKEHHYVSYYPQGRMDLCSALANGHIPVTRKLVEIADECSLCGICDKQCHFITGMRPGIAMKSLKDHIAVWLSEGGEIREIETDAALERLKGIVGAEWASNDPAILVTYSNDPFPLKGMQMPAYVVLPDSAEQIADIVRFARESGLSYVARGNGGSVFGMVFSDGIVIDTCRMKSILIDKENWVAIVGPGATSFEVQSEVHKHGFRINTAEPAATVCGNIICTGMFSTWSNTYGVASDNLVNAQFVDEHGNTFSLADEKAANLFAFRDVFLPPPPAICTGAHVKMYPTTEDEEGLLVPFDSFNEAVGFARELSKRRIGIALAVLGDAYLSNFISPSNEISEKVRTSVIETLGIKALVFMVGDRFARGAVEKMTDTIIDNDLFRTLMLGLPRLVEDEWSDLLRGYESDVPLFKILCRKEMSVLLESVLSPSPETFSTAIEKDLRDFYSNLYTRPEMTNLVWMNMFRIVSSRMGRNKHVVVFVIYTPLDRIDFIESINSIFKEAGDRHGVENAYGFLTPIDFGKRAVLEYDYYIDQTDPMDAQRIGRIIEELVPILEKLRLEHKGFEILQRVLSQGLSRKEHFLYRQPQRQKGRNSMEGAH